MALMGLFLFYFDVKCVNFTLTIFIFKDYFYDFCT